MDTPNEIGRNMPTNFPDQVFPEPKFNISNLIKSIRIKHVIIFFAVVAVFMMIALSFAQMSKALSEIEATITPTPARDKVKDEPVVKQRDLDVTPQVSSVQIPVADQKIVFVDSENRLYEINPNATGRKLLYESQKKFLDIAASPDGAKLAFTLRFDQEATTSSILKPIENFLVKDVYAGAANFGYPISKLFVLDMSTLKLEQIATPDNSTVRYPRWSTDGIYLTFWLNDGQSSKVYSFKDKKFVLEVTADSENEKVSPIVFVPGKKDTVAYIYKNTLRELALTGKGKVSYLEDLEAIRWVHEGPPLPNAPMYSRSGQLVALYKTNGDLIIFDKSTNKSELLVKGEVNGPFGVTPYGYAIGFNPQNDFIFMGMSDGAYQVNDKMPLYIYLNATKEKKDFTPSAKNLDIGSFLVSSAGSRILAHSFLSDKGSVLFDGVGNVVRDCTDTNFRYPYYSWGSGPDHASVSKVWSSNEQSVLSESGDTLSVLNAYNCEVTKVLDEKVTLSSWINIAK